MKIATCPYCDGDHFSTEVIRGDKPDLPEDIANIEGIEIAMDKFKSVYGYWFNQCLSCDGWSVHKNGKNFPLEKKNKKPKKHSLDPIKE